MVLSLRPRRNWQTNLVAFNYETPVLNTKDIVSLSQHVFSWNLRLNIESLQVSTFEDHHIAPTCHITIFKVTKLLVSCVTCLLVVLYVWHVKNGRLDNKMLGGKIRTLMATLMPSTSIASFAQRFSSQRQTF